MSTLDLSTNYVIGIWIFVCFRIYSIVCMSIDNNRTLRRALKNISPYIIVQASNDEKNDCNEHVGTQLLRINKFRFKSVGGRKKKKDFAAFRIKVLRGNRLNLENGYFFFN